MSKRLKPTPEIIDQIAARIRGTTAPPHLAAVSLGLDGLTLDTFLTWMDKASRAKRGVYRTLREKIQTAEALAQVSLASKAVAGTGKGAASSWLAWELLRARYPGWTQPKQVEVKHGVTSDLQAMIRDAQKLRGYDPRTIPISPDELKTLPKDFFAPLCLPPGENPAQQHAVREGKTLSRPCRSGHHEFCARKTCRCTCHKRTCAPMGDNVLQPQTEPRPIEVMHGLPEDLRSRL